MDHRTDFFLRHVTNLGDSGLLAVLAVVVSIYLYCIGQKRDAGVLFLILCLCVGTMAVLKIVFIGCGHLIPSLDIRSPSGHAAMAAAIYGTLATIISHHYTDWRRVMATTLSFYLIAVISVSRFLLDYHSMMEVALGLAIGVVLMGVSSLLLRGAPRGNLKLHYLAALCGASVALLYQTHAPAEALITRIADWAQASFHYCT